MEPIDCSLQQRVLNGVEAARAAALNNETYPVSRQYAQAAASYKVPWAAVHVRAFVCEQNRREPSFAHVAAALAKLGIRSGFVYVVSSVPVEQVQRALPAYTVVAKSTFLGSDAQQPFEALAAIDYGVAMQAPLYLGERKRLPSMHLRTKSEGNEGDGRPVAMPKSDLTNLVLAACELPRVMSYYLFLRIFIFLH